MSAASVLVQVFGNERDCRSCCASPIFPMEYVVAQLADDLKADFGQRVEVTYVDTDVVELADYPHVAAALERGYPIPVIVINGEPKFAGGINLPEIKRLLTDLLES